MVSCCEFKRMGVHGTLKPRSVLFDLWALAALLTLLWPPAGQPPIACSFTGLLKPREDLPPMGVEAQRGAQGSWLGDLVGLGLAGQVPLVAVFLSSPQSAQ